MAQIHRFRDAAAISVGMGDTRYMSAADARKVAAALLRVAQSIEREPFHASRGLTAQFMTYGTGDIAQLERRPDGRAIGARKR